MNNITELRVFQQARANLKHIHHICKGCKRYGDIQNQIERAAISVISNIAEGRAGKMLRILEESLRTLRPAERKCSPAGPRPRSKRSRCWQQHSQVVRQIPGASTVKSHSDLLEP